MGTTDIDNILKQATALSAELAMLPDDDPNRPRLEQRQAQLRAQAHELALERRHPVSIEHEIAMLEQRLDDISAMLITKGYNEKHLGNTIQDPGAYSNVINRLIATEHADEVREIDAKLSALRSARLDQEEESS